MSFPDFDDPRLTEREKRALQVMVDQREAYKASGHIVASKTIGIVLLLVWQVFIRTPHNVQAPPEMAGHGEGHVLYVVTWVGQSPSGTAVIDANLEPERSDIAQDMPSRLRLVFANSELPYRSGISFWAQRR
jgi:hypothetical protein